jgi:uncharacterized protein (DUF1778 family)
MIAPISIRLDPDVREILEAKAQAEGTSLSCYLRQLATATARDIRRARIRSASAEVACYVATNPDARAFFEDWGTPLSEGLK